MFLTERLVGIGIYLLILAFVCVLIMRTNIRCRSVFAFYVICLAIMGFMYKPYVTADLYRIFNMIDLFSDLEFSYFWKYYAADYSAVVSRVLYWCIGQIGIKELLPALSVMVVYSIIFGIIEKARAIYSISRRTVADALIFIMVTSIYLSTVGGIRMMLAISFIAFCFFRETVERKINIWHIVLYFAAFLTHNVALIVIIVRLAALILSSEQTKLKKIFSVFGIVFGIALFSIFFRDIVGDIVDKAFGYITGGSYYDVWEYIMGALLLLLLLIVGANYKMDMDKNIHSGLKQLNVAMCICIAISLVFCFEFSIFYRFIGHLAPVFSIPLCMVTLERSGDKKCIGMKRMSLRSVFLLITVAIMAISFSRGSMSSLKFFELQG